MKTKVKRMSKRTLAVFLGVIMLVTTLFVGSITTVTATKLDNITDVWIADQDGWIGSYAHGSGVLSKVNNDSNRWDTTLYVLGSKNSTYNRYFKMGVKCSGWPSDGYWGAGVTWSGSTYEKNIWDRYGQDNDTLELIQSSSTGWIKVKFELYGSYNNDSRLGIYQNTVSSLSLSSLTRSASSVSGGGTVTLGGNASGGSGNYSYSYTVKDASGNTVSNCISGNTFTAPYVAESTTYTITGTLSDATITELPSPATKSTTVTVTPKTSTSIKLSGTQALTGTAWAGANVAQGMTQVGSENYRLVFNDVPAGTHEFKIIKDNNWYGYSDMTGGRTLNGDAATGSITQGSGSNGNIKFETTAPANITIDFKAGTGWTITVTADPAGPTYYVASGTGDGVTGQLTSGSSWDMDDNSGKMTLTSGTTYTKKFTNVAAGTYQFRISDGTNGVGQYSTYTITGNAVTSLSGTYNVKFELAAKSNVTITFDSAQVNNKYPVTVTVREVSEDEGSDVWPPEGINDSGSNLNKFLYVKGSGNDAFKDSEINVLDMISLGSGNYWVDLTSVLPVSNRLYFSAANQSSTNGIYKTGTIQFDTTNMDSNMAASSTSHSNSGNRPFACLSGFAQASITHLGIKITEGSDYFKYTIYTSSGSSSSVTNVNIYAKDGVVRNYDSYGPYITLAKIADTAISTTVDRDGKDATITVTDHPYSGDASRGDQNQDYQTATARAGDTITVTTTIDSTNRSKYYVKGFVVNGETPATFTWNSNGVYTLNYTIKDNEFNNKVEITPVFFLVDDSNTINFAIEGFTDEIKGLSATGSQIKWGTTMYVYPFYANSAGNSIEGKQNAFGSYPGQPLLFDGGKYYVQIPKTITYSPSSGTTATATVQGVTMSNGYWDHVHREVIGWPSEDSGNNIIYHRQTYDYDDFYKISTELTPDNITYEFKYETTKENNSVTTANSYTSTELTTTFTNGFEDLEDIYGRKIDIFGNVLSGADLTKTPVYVVSKGYQVTNAGSYATEWEIFYPNAAGTTFTKAKSGSNSEINPAALVLTNSSNFTTYSNDKFSSYKALYDVLNSTDIAKSRPALITFENEQLNSSGDRAYRSDGQWYHSRNNDIISSQIKIEYRQSDGSYLEDPFVGSTNVGTTTGAKAYFTNEENNKDGQSYYGKTSTGQVYSNNKEYFTFTAEPSAEYELEGWYRLVNGTYYPITGEAQSPKTNNDVYVARFRTVKSGTLTVSHTLLQDAQCKGNGATSVKLEVLATQNATDADYSTGFKSNSATLTSKYIKYNSTKYVRVTLQTTPSGEDTFAKYFYNGATTADTTYFPSGGTTVTTGSIGGNGVVTKVFTFPISGLFDQSSEDKDQTVSMLTYNSLLNKTSFAYSIKYYFDGRYFGNGTNSQWFTVSGDLTSNDVSNYITKSGGNYYISSNFISSKKPYERDFMRDITWDFSTASTTAATASTSNNVITLSLDVREAATTADATRTAIFKLPYFYNPNDNYNFYDWVPIPITEKRENVQGGKYVVTTGYYYDHDNPQFANGHIVYSVENENYVETQTPWESAVQEVNGKKIPIYDSTTNVPTFTVSTNYGKRFSLDEVYNESDKNSTYVTAPESVYDKSSSTVKHFSHWNITSTKNGKIVAKCYHRKFNFSAYENYIVEPVFDGTVDNQYISDSEQEAPDSSISFLDSSRNQWNDNGGGESSDSAADVLFKDFALTFNYKSKVLNDYEDEHVRVGMVVERVAALETDSNGQYLTTLSVYEDRYKNGVNDVITEIKNRVVTGSKTAGNTMALNIQKIASNVESDSGYGELSDNSLIDNKNRLKYYFSVYNKKVNTEYTYKNYVYRAYTYIMIKDKTGSWTTDRTYVTSDPAYFTFYDIASK